MNTTFMPSMGWNRYFLAMAEVASMRSKDPSTKVGVVLVKNQRMISTGYNGFPTGVTETLRRWERPEKYLWVEHAERNALYSAASAGIATAGASLYLWATAPIGVCADCARGIIQSGVTRIVGYRPNFDRSNYGESFVRAYAMLLDAGIEIVDHDDITIRAEIHEHINAAFL